jgi:hypothetical protein
MIGSKKYNSASLTSKYNYDTAARKNIIKFLEVVSPGSKQKIKGFKNIDPDKLGNILESIESRISDFGFESGTKRQAQLAIADAAKGLPPRTGEELMVKLRQKGKAVDHVVPLASVFKDAPGYTEAGQVIDFDINKKKGTTLDAAFGREFKKALKGDFSGVEKYNDKALNFATKNKVDTPVIIQGDNLNPRDYIKNFDSYSEGAKQNIINLAKEKGIVIQTNTKTLASLADELVKGTETFNKAEQIEVCNFLSNGGLPGDCKRAIKQNPRKASQIISQIKADNPKLLKVKNTAKNLNALFETGQITTADNLPRPDDAKLADTFKETNLRWNNDVGAFETTNGDIASQSDIKKYAADNPMEVKVGEEPVKAATNKSVLSNVGKAMARIGAPLPTALLDSYFIGQQVKEGKGTAEIASNPLNWLGLATMEPLTKVSGVATGSGALNKALRLGLNPATIRGISRFAGLPGLAISTAMTAYDQYQKYKDGEGFIFNLLNQKGTE